MTKPKPLPHSIDAEESLISAILLDPAESIAKADESGIDPKSFYVPANQIIYQRLYAMYVAGKPIETATLAEDLKSSGFWDQVGGLPYLVRISGRISTTASIPVFIERIRSLATRRKVIKVARAAVEKAHDEKQDIEEITTPLRSMGEGSEAIAERLNGAFLRFEQPPPEPAPRWFIDRKPIATPGNITAIIAQAKSGKTTWASALVASCIVADNEANGMESGLFDTLGAQSAAPSGRVLLYVDTEQTRFDSYRGFVRAFRRAGMESPPDWFRPYSLKGWSAPDARKAVRHLVRDLVRRQIPVFAIIVDGLADLCCDVNDPKESNELVCEMESHAVTADCPVVCVIHRNEGQKADSAARGHLGKQLARKAETNLRLEKREGKTVVFADQNRGAPITEKDGPCFEWSDERGCHVSSKSLSRTKEDDEKEQLLDRIQAVFSTSSEMRWADIHAKLMTDFGRSKNSAERDIKRMRSLNLIIPAGKNGMFTPNPQ